MSTIYDVEKTLQAIADGYEYYTMTQTGDDSALILVENPDYKEDDGSFVYLSFYTDVLEDPDK
jgi:hypothetical protein